MWAAWESPHSTRRANSPTWFGAGSTLRRATDFDGNCHSASADASQRITFSPWPDSRADGGLRKFGVPESLRANPITSDHTCPGPRDGYQRASSQPATAAQSAQPTTQASARSSRTILAGGTSDSRPGASKDHGRGGPSPSCLFEIVRRTVQSARFRFGTARLIGHVVTLVHADQSSGISEGPVQCS